MKEKKLIITVIIMMMIIFNMIPAKAEERTDWYADDPRYNVKVTLTCNYKNSVKFLNLLNADREKLGKSTLELDDAATNIMVNRALENYLFFSHSNADKWDPYLNPEKTNGLYLYDEDKYGYNGMEVVVGDGYYNIVDAYNALKKSKGHWDTLINSRGKYLGVAFVTDEYGLSSCTACIYNEKEAVLYDKNYVHTNNIDYTKSKKESRIITICNQGTKMTMSDCFEDAYFDTSELDVGMKNKFKITKLEPTMKYYSAVIDNDSFYWTSSDPDVITVDDNGNFEAVGTGKATITATVKDCISGDAPKCSRTITVVTHSHEWVTLKNTKATCTKDGVKTKECLRCGKVSKKITKALGHNYKTYKTIKAKCTKNGKQYKKCSRCKKKKTVCLKALGHKWKLIKIIKKATCGEDGSRKYKCSRCKKTTIKVIKATLVAKVNSCLDII